MSFDYRKFLLENGLTVGSQLRNQFSEEELPQSDEQEPQEEVPTEADPAKKAKLDKLTAMKDEILAQYKSGKLSLDQYKAKVGNIPQQIQQLRTDIDAELNPEVPEEEPVDDQQTPDQPKSEELPQKEPAEEENAWNSLQEGINQLNKKNMSFDYRKFLKENELTVSSKGKKKFMKEEETFDEGYGLAGSGDQGYDDEFYNHDPDASRLKAKISQNNMALQKKISDMLAPLVWEKNHILSKYKSGEITIDQYKKEIGDIPQQIKALKQKELELLKK